MRFAQVAAWAWLAGLLALPIAGHAGGESAGFEIRVTLHSGAGIPGNGTPPDGGGEERGAICTSQTRASDRSALIEVLCAVGPYVNIAPAAGAQDAATSDPWRYDFGPRSPMVRAALSLGTVRAPQLAGGGTLTALQVTNASGDGSALEMLVSF